MNNSRAQIALAAVVTLFATLLSPMAISASAAPAAVSITPSAGTKFGGNNVTITGADFIDVSGSAVVDVALSVSSTLTSMSFTVASSTRIDATLPVQGSPITGMADIVVAFSDGSTGVLPYRFLTSSATTSPTTQAPAVGSFTAVLQGYGLQSGGTVTAQLSTSAAIFDLSVTVNSDTQATVTVPVIDASSRSANAAFVLSFTNGDPVSTIPVRLVGATVSAIVPTSGTAAGGTDITISGTAFQDANGAAAVTKIQIGADVITSSNFTVVSNTVITASIPSRSGNQKTVGAMKVAVFYADDVSSSDTVFYYFTPERDASKDVAGLVMLGELASRSERKPVSRTSAAPFLVYGVDSLTNQQYDYETNYDYGSSGAYAREGHQPGYTKYVSGQNLLTTPSPNITGTITAGDSGATLNQLALDRSAVSLVSNGSCGFNNNNFASTLGGPTLTTYCSVFGPEIYSETFYGKAGQSLAFAWRARGDQDDYSVYAYLVAVANETNIPSTDPASHTLVAHSVGSRNASVAAWRTDVANIPTDGLYRFRFTNGSYDGTGGFAIGSTFFVSDVFEAGLSNSINFGPISDQIGASGTFNVTATAVSGGEVSVISRDTNKCTVTRTYSRPTTTITVTKLATGTCILVASRGLDGEYAPAADKLVAFEIRSTAVAAEAPVITKVTPGDQSLTVDFARPSRDGGYAISNYEYSTDNGVTWVSVSPTSTATQLTITNETDTGNPLSNGTTYSVKVRAVTDPSVGAGLASAPVNGIPNAPSGPSLTYASASVLRTQGVVTQILQPTNTGGAATSYALASGTLPPGLTLNTTTGVISGNPTTVGTYTVGITGTNSSSTSPAATLTITIAPQAANPPSITYSAGVSLSYVINVGQQLTVPAPTNSNTVDAANFTILPALPSGIAINSTTGEVTGTPDVAISQTVFTVKAENSAGSSTVSFTLTVILTAPVLSPNVDITLPIGAMATINGPGNSGGRVASFTISPNLPAGLVLNTSSGVITGTPTAEIGRSAFVLTGTNAAGSSSISIIITVKTSGGNGGNNYNGPLIISLTPRVTQTAGGETITVTGLRLGVGESVTIGGVQAKVLTSTETGFTFVMPALPVASYDMLYVYSGGARLSYLDAISVQAVNNWPQGGFDTNVPSPSDWSALGIASNFEPGSSVITPTVRNQVVTMLRTYAKWATKIECSGFTMGPTVLKADAVLSKARAVAVCGLIKQLRPRLTIVRAVGKQETKIGGAIRRVEVLFTRD